MPARCSGDFAILWPKPGQPAFHFARRPVASNLDVQTALDVARLAAELGPRERAISVCGKKTASVCM